MIARAHLDEYPLLLLLHHVEPEVIEQRVHPPDDDRRPAEHGHLRPHAQGVAVVGLGDGEVRVR